MGEYKVTFPRVVFGPVSITRLDAVEGDTMRFRLEQRIDSFALAGLVPLVTMPGHDEPSFRTPPGRWLYRREARREEPGA